MLDFYYWPTPNGWKVSILLEELRDAIGLDYTLKPVNIGKGEQFEPAFLAISPNHRMPALVDHEPPDGWGDEPVTIFESGAIMLYLAEKTGRFLAPGLRARKETLEWLFWQTGNQGPMAGQLSHFVNYATGGQDYGRERYSREYDRNAGVLERRLDGRDWIVGEEYTIADMICWPWLLIAKPLTASLDGFPNVSAWRNRIKERPAVQRGVDVGKELRRSAPPDDEERKILFEQTAATAKTAG